jgi:2-haloacid dehalogenase
MTLRNNGIVVAVFDAYGTLLDVHSAMQRHANRIGEAWQTISQEWRQKQIEYTWVRSLAGPAQHRDFSQLTDEALAFVAAKHGISDHALLADLRAAYRALDAYAEAPAMLKALREAGIATAILSNGEPEMLAAGVKAAGIDGVLDAVLSVETAGVFKPDQRVYQLAVDHFGAPVERMAFMSSNPWDAFGASVFGFRVHWINRLRQPDEYDLRARVTELSDLSTLATLLA